MNKAEAAENLTIMAGQDTELPLSVDTKQQLTSAYFKLYYGMSWLNWTDKKSSLGTAWQRALEQINAFAGAKDAKNPAGAYIRKINAAHQKKWPITILTHENSDKKLTASDEQIAIWRQNAQRQINSALGTISLIMAQHRVQDNTQVAAQEQTVKKQQTKEQTVEKINVVERTIERIHVNDIYVKRVHEQNVAQTQTTEKSAVQVQQTQQPAQMPMAQQQVVEKPAEIPVAQTNVQHVATHATRTAAARMPAAARRALSVTVARAMRFVKTKPAERIVPQTTKPAINVVQPAVAHQAVAKPARPARPSMPIAMQIAAPQIKAHAKLMAPARFIPAQQHAIMQKPRTAQMPAQQIAKPAPNIVRPAPRPAIPAPVPKAIAPDTARRAMVLKPVFMYYHQRQNQRAA